MEVESFLQHCQERQIHLRMENGELRYRAVKGAMTDAISTELKRHKSKIISYLNDREVANFNSTFQLTPASSDERGLLFDRVAWIDYAARRMENAMANIPHIVIRVADSIRVDILVKSIDALLERHDVLSSVIEMSEGNLYLARRAKQKPAFQAFVAEADTPQQREQEAMQIANEWVWKEYDLDSGPLYRVFLIRLSESDHILGVGLHHAIGDGLSIGILFNELLVIYGSLLADVVPPLPVLRMQYMDYLTSMNGWLASAAGKEHLLYWVRHLKSAPVTHLLPSYREPAGPANETMSAEETIAFDSTVSDGLKNAAAKLKTTPFTLLLVAQKVALWRMTAQTELVIVVIKTGRTHRDMQTMIGNFAAEVAYKTSLAGNPTLSEIVDRLNQTIVEAENHQPIPFDLIRQQLSKEGMEFTAPVVGYLPSPPTPAQEAAGPRRLRFPLPAPLNSFPGTYGIQFRDSPDGIQGTLVYRKDFYQETAILEYLNHLRLVVQTLTITPDVTIQELPAGSREREIDMEAKRHRGR